MASILDTQIAYEAGLVSSSRAFSAARRARSAQLHVDLNPVFVLARQHREEQGIEEVGPRQTQVLRRQPPKDERGLPFTH